MHVLDLVTVLCMMDQDLVNSRGYVHANYSCHLSCVNDRLPNMYS